LLPATQNLEKFSREAGLLVNNIFLFSFTVTVFIGTLYPLFYTVINGQDLSVGPPYFNGVLLPLLVPFILLMSCGPYLVWSHRAPASVLRHLSPLFAFVIALGLCGFFMAQWPVAACVGIGTGVFLALSTINHALRHRHAATIRYFGMILAHLGLAFVIIGMACTTLLKSESIRWMQPQDQEKIASYNITFERYEAALGPNYNIDRVTLTLQNKKSKAVTQLQPEKRWYPAAEKMTTETGMYMTPWGGMIYAVQGEQDSKNPERWVIRLYHHPLVFFILLGAGLMAFGGLLPFARRSLS
jgi:cytochrome c-type biogenesis protein CcmF